MPDLIVFGTLRSAKDLACKMLAVIDFALLDPCDFTTTLFTPRKHAPP